MDDRCMGGFSSRSAVCGLCTRVSECRDVDSNPRKEKSKEEAKSEKRCRDCANVARSSSGFRFDKCLHDDVRQYCVGERARRYEKGSWPCGMEGMLWEPRPPTFLEKVAEAVRRAVRGPEGLQEGPVRKGLMEVLREAVRGPGAGDGGGKGV